MKKRPVSSVILKLALLVFFALAVLLPLLRMLAYMGNTDVLKVLRSAAFRKACLNSLKVGLLTTVVSIPLAYACILSSKNPWFCQSKFLGIATGIPW